MQLNLRFRSFWLIVLTGVLAIAGMGCSAANLGPSSPSPVSSPVSSPVPVDRVEQTRSVQFPETLAAKLRADLSQSTGIAAEQLRVVKTTPETWPDGCLGLPKPEEVCSAMLVSGWQVVLADGDRQWVYRTDRSGRSYRMQSP